MVRGLILQRGHASRGSLWLIDQSLTALFGISPPFDELFPTEGQIIHALLTRAPLYFLLQAGNFSFDLHVLGTPPAFILSQDQTLQLN